MIDEIGFKYDEDHKLMNIYLLRAVFSFHPLKHHLETPC